MCAATGAVRKTKSMVARARVVMASSPKCTATAPTMQPIPSVEALVLACIRIKRSGMRRMPTPASSANVAPISRSAELKTSFIKTLPLHESRECHGSQKGNQSEHNCHIQKNRLPRSNGIGCRDSRGQDRYQIERNHAVGQTG